MMTIIDIIIVVLIVLFALYNQYNIKIEIHKFLKIEASKPTNKDNSPKLTNIVEKSESTIINDGIDKKRVREIIKEEQSPITNEEIDKICR